MRLLDRAHSRLHQRVVFDRRVEVLARHLADALPEAATVLDVGCGDGSIAARVMQHRPDVTITGIDVLVRPATRIPVEAFDGEVVPFADGTFDAVTFVDELHHTDDPTTLLLEAARVARRAVVVKDHLAEGVLARPTLRLMDWVGNASHGVVLPYNYWDRSQWASGLATAGLTIADERTDLGLYPPPATRLFDRGLHVVWRLTPHGSPAG